MSIVEYRRRLERFGKSKRERTIFRAQYMARRLGPASPAYKEVEIDGAARSLLVVSTQTMTTKTIEAVPGEDFSIGAIVLWNKSHWLITQRDAESDVTVRGTIEQCNRTIKWQNPETGEIHERWCVVDNPYSNSLDTSATLTESQRQFKIKMPYDRESALIDLDKRFMLETIGGMPRTYHTVAIDSMTERYDYDGDIKGFLSINVKQDAYNPKTDNKELGICDYVLPGEETAPDAKAPVALDIVCRGAAEVKAGGPGKVFTARFREAETGRELAGKAARWDVRIAPEMEKYISACVDGNFLTVLAQNVPDVIGARLEISASEVDGSAASSLLAEVVPLV